MQSYLLSNKKIFLPIGLLALITALSYVNFQVYQPKILRQIQEVKGYKTEDVLNLPYPQSSIEISVNKTKTSKQITLQTQKTADDIQRFYRNILIVKDWQIEAESTNDTFLTTKYKKDAQRITVNSSRQNSDGYTIVTIDIDFSK